MSKRAPRLTAVTLAAVLMLAGTAEAGPLFAGAEASPWSLAWEWLTKTWADLTGLDSTSLSTSAPSTSSEPPTTTNSEYGCGIDPNGVPFCG